ncbi:hypothetical protein [Shewanella xiamenensis]|uniref:hypothetical protein n=1 Tax=Shewanella xiamenensis TaxID=332186 RepID=UPI00313EC460
MNEKIDLYLGILPLTHAVRERVKTVIACNQMIMDDEILDVFINDMKNSEGGKEYSSLWIFTKLFIIECKNFLSENDFDIVPYVHNVKYSSVKSIDFDFVNVTDKSSMIVNCLLNTVSCTFIATDKNCSELFRLYKEHIIPNLNVKQ